MISLSVPDISFVNNPVPVIITTDVFQPITMQILLNDIVVFESAYSIDRQLKLDISDILKTFVTCQDSSCKIPEPGYTFDSDSHIRNYQVTIFSDTQTAITRTASAVYGGIPTRFISPDFLNEAVGDSLFILSTRSFGQFYFLRETEIGLLRFFTKQSRIIIVSPKGNCFTIESNPSDNLKMCTVDLAYVRNWFLTKKQELAAYFTFIVNGEFAAQVVLTPCIYSSEKNILEFRNSLGGYDRLEITGKQEWSLEYDDEDSEYSVWDNQFMDYTLSSSGKKYRNTISANVGFKNKKELQFIKDLLLSPDVRLLSSESTQKVLVTSDDYKVRPGASEPGAITLQIKFATAENNYLPDKDTFIIEDMPGEWFLQQGTINSKGFIYSQNFIRTI